MPSLLAHQPGPGSHTGVTFSEKFAQIQGQFFIILEFFWKVPKIMFRGVWRGLGGQRGPLGTPENP